MSAKTGNKNGRKWIRDERRLAIMLRDGLECAWCGRGIEDGAHLTLDHYRTRASGVDNSSTNLVTACMECNVRRGAKKAPAFAMLIGTPDRSGVKIYIEINRKRRRRPDIMAAKRLILDRGGFTKALYGS